MYDFVEELKRKKILVKADIIRLRHYIEKKHPHSDQSKRAHILAKSIADIIDQHLIHFPIEYRKDIKSNLVNGPLSNSVNGVFLYDVFEASLEIDDSYEYYNSICKWINGVIHPPINIDTIKSYKSIVKGCSYQDEAYVIPQTLELKSDNIDYTLSPDGALEGRGFRVIVDLHHTLMLVSIALVLISLWSSFFYKSPDPLDPDQYAIRLHTPPPTVYEVIASHSPAYFNYKVINQDKIKLYLDSRNSLLKEEPYFSAIIETAKAFNLNPLILFAIAGHEQAFVPRSHPSANKIANNPYNVFGSWQRYNTDIHNSSEIAARTVSNLLKGLPEGMDPFQWINRRYAEDENWWKGVRSLYNQIEEAVN